MLPNDAHIKGSTLSNSTAPPSASLPEDSPHHPKNVYYNLVLLEYDLRLQYLEMKVLRRKWSTIFYTVVAVVGWLGNRLFTFGGSDNRYIYAFERLFFFSGFAWLLYFYFSGGYQWKMVYPRKFVHTANRGMRQFNLKLVSVKMSWRERLEGLYYQFMPPLIPERRRPLPPPQPQHSQPHRRKRANSVLGHNRQRSTTPEPTSAAAASPKRPTPSRLGTPSSIASSSDDEPAKKTYMISEPETLLPSDLVPCGNYVKLVILAKGFSPEFREGWELYRTDYWEQENRVRAIMRAEALELLEKELREDMAQTKADYLASLPFGLGAKFAPPPPQRREYEGPPPTRRPRRLSTTNTRRRSLLAPDADQGRRSPSPYPASDASEVPTTRMERTGSAASVRMERTGSTKSVIAGVSPSKSTRSRTVPRATQAMEGVEGGGTARARRSVNLKERRTESGPA